MPSVSERHRNNVRAGVFVTAALIASLAVLIVLSDVVNAIWRSTETYTVTFDVASGVANLKSGSDVRVGGVRMGKVLQVEPIFQNDVFRTIAVTFNVDRRVAIYADAHIIVTAPLIGSDAWLDIPYVGDPKNRLPEGARLQGISSVGLLTTLLGSENASKASEMVENARTFTNFLAMMPGEYENRIVPAVDHISAAAANADAIMKDMRDVHWPEWSLAVDHIMQWAVDTTPKLDAAFAEGHDLLANTNAIVKENREPIQAIVGNVETVSARLNQETLEKVHALLDSGQKGLDQANAVLESMRVDYAGWSSTLGETFAKLNLTAQQLKLASIETRRSPWKLLYRPSADELQHELLYESTRSFAMAAADLRATSEAINRILEQHGDKVKADEETFRRLERNLAESLTNYETAQQRLLDVLVTDIKQ